MDDVSDSGVMSLPTSDDEHHEFNLDGPRTDDDCSKKLQLYGPIQEARSDRDVKSRLLSMCQAAGTVSERICLQQALALLRHYEARIEGLESTIAAMCHEATMSRSLSHCKPEITSESDTKSSGKIVATVLPFSEACTSSGKCDHTENRKELTESGIFDDHLVSSRGTQTDSKKWHTANLTAELEKLTRIRERIETAGKPIQAPKDLSYYEKRIEALQSRLVVYESSEDEQTKALRSVIQRSTLLTAQVTHLHEKISRLEKDNTRLEEERSELEELENDARLRCQRLESKLSTLGERKRSLKNQLEDLRREMNDREVDLHDENIEALVELYEKKNQELEEREMEVRCRLQMLESTMPALMMWNIWKMMMTMQGGAVPMAVGGTQSAIPMTNMDMSKMDELSEMNEMELINKEDELAVKLRQLENKLNTQNKILADSKATEDSLRIKLQQLENWMTGANTGSVTAKDLDADVEIFEKLSKMARDRIDMDKRIKDFELKEKVFKETLEQADDMIAQLESQFTSQIQEKDQELHETAARLRDSDTRLKTAEKGAAQTLVMQDRVTLLEDAVEQLKKTLSTRDRERERLEQEHARLIKEVQQSQDNLEAMKAEMDAAKKKLEGFKKSGKQLEDDLKHLETEKDAFERKSTSEVSAFKSQISQLQRDLMENEVTISELKEEVVTLESAVDELRYTMRLEKAEKEEITKMYEAKLEVKEKELEEAKNNVMGKEDMNVKSIMEELEEGENNDKNLSNLTWNRFHSEAQCYRADVGFNDSHTLYEPISKLKRPTVSPPPPPPPKTIPVISTDRSPNMTASQFNAFITLIEEGEPHVDVMSTKGIPLSPSYSPNNLPSYTVQNYSKPSKMSEPEDSLQSTGSRKADSVTKLSSMKIRGVAKPDPSMISATASQTDNLAEVIDVPRPSTSKIPERASKTPERETKSPERRSKSPERGSAKHSEQEENIDKECKDARDAVNDISKREAKLTVDALSKAYNHAKICGECNAKLGNVVGDLVKKLGVRMPRVKGVEDICDYGGTRSDLKTKKVGPGSVGWDPKSSRGGYKVRPTVSSLILSTEELKDKCLRKDAIIEVLADELRVLERNGRWHSHRMMQDLAQYPNPSPIDFNRQTLVKYLNNELLNDFDQREDSGEEFFATNPLGLTIVRQVGPDSLLVKWLPIADPKITSYEIYGNGVIMQRILSPGRSKALLHPIDPDKKIILTLNALSYDGEKRESATVQHH